ncbi:MAG: PEP-CTERM sorting domain-containing protein [Pirellulales bacterium]|nr:PEP-CTERM sorting domain-containing protein [Pirellulales bacterium]
MIVNSKKTCFSCFLHQFRFAHALILAGLLSAWAGPGRAGLFSPSVEVTLSGDSWSCGINVCPTHVSQTFGPVTAGASPTSGQNAAAFTDYGRNGSGVSMWANRPYGAPQTGHYGWINATSKWTDVLTVSTPSAAPGAPVDVVFSIRLHGHMEANSTPYALVYSRMGFGMLLNEYGDWITRPSLQHDIGAGYSGPSSSVIDVDEIQHGRFRVPNGAAFNLISELSTYVRGEFLGPWDQNFDAESAFGNSAQWLGGSVWIGDTPLSDFTLASASGFDYRLPAVPEPGMLALLGIGLSCVGALRRSRMLG